jgi:putative transposon-encoded protein
MNASLLTNLLILAVAAFIVLSGVGLMSSSTHALAPAAPKPTIDFGNFEVLDQLSFERIFSIGKSVTEAAQPGKKPLTSLANMIFQIGIVVLIMVSLISIVFGGYVYMTAGGNSAQITSAKSYIGSALLGIVLALTGWLILTTVNPEFTNPPEPVLVLPPAPAP